MHLRTILPLHGSVSAMHQVIVPRLIYFQVLRLGKPLEHLQAALKAALASGPAGEQITTIGRQISYFGYLSFDALVWVRLQSITYWNRFWHCLQSNTIKLYSFSSETSTKITKLAYRFWLAGILLSIVNGTLKVSPLHIISDTAAHFYQSVRLAKEERRLKHSKTWGEKDAGQERQQELRLSTILAYVLPVYSPLYFHW